MRNKSLLGAMAILFLLTACGKKEEQAPQAGPMPFPVQTVSRQNATIYEEYPANLEGQQNVEIRPKVEGFVDKVYVDEGQEVRKGQVLFTLETRMLTQNAAGARANVAAAQVEVDRLKPLVDRKIISKVQLETAQAQLEQAKAVYQGIATNINYGTITSPVNGVIGSIPYKPGALVNSNIEMPLTTVSDSKIVRAYFTMNEKQVINFSKTFKGSSLQEKLKNTPAVSLILVDGSEYDLEGRLETVNGQVNATTGSTQFRADFKNPEAVLRSGGKGTVRIPIHITDAIEVPQNAVFDMQGKQMIYVVGKDNTVKSKIVQVRTTTGQNFIIESGLEPGDVIVVEGASKLKDGMAIVPQPKAAEAAPAPADTDSTATTKTTTVTKK